jgi:putative acetyltransferase
MKIRKPTPATYNKVYGLLQQTFPGSSKEKRLVERLHRTGRIVHEWFCIHTNKAIAYIAFTNAYNGNEICGLHLAPLAVNPEFQNQGIGTELMHFAMRQDGIKNSTVFVLGHGGFYQRFGFEPCSTPICPFSKKNAHFYSIHNVATTLFTVGYEPEFSKM